jgi:Bardet-Biedl syndrome 1 protein
LTVCDLRSDSYYKLIAAEVPLSLEPKPARLRVYKGNQVVNDQALPGYPSSVQSLYIDEIEPKMPSKIDFQLEIGIKIMYCIYLQ